MAEVDKQRVNDERRIEYFDDAESGAEDAPRLISQMTCSFERERWVRAHRIRAREAVRDT